MYDTERFYIQLIVTDLAFVKLRQLDHQQLSETFLPKPLMTFDENMI